MATTIARQMARVQQIQTALDSYSDEELSQPLWEVARNASDFFLICSWASAQKKSKDIEYYLCRRMGWHYVEAVEDRGDSHDDDGTYYELKTSTTNDDHLLNIRQIRLWQDVDYYICSYVDEYDIANSWCVNYPALIRGEPRF